MFEKRARRREATFEVLSVGSFPHRRTNGNWWTENRIWGYQFSIPHLYISLKKVGRMYFLNLGVEGLIYRDGNVKRKLHVDGVYTLASSVYQRHTTWRQESQLSYESNLSPYPLQTQFHGTFSNRTISNTNTFAEGVHIVNWLLYFPATQVLCSVFRAAHFVLVKKQLIFWVSSCGCLGDNCPFKLNFIAQFWSTDFHRCVAIYSSGSSLVFVEASKTGNFVERFW